MIDNNERNLIRDLAKRYFEIALLPVMEDRRKRWKQHNSLQKTRPMVLVFPEGSWGELLPGSAIQCVNEEARGLEWAFRAQIYAFEHFKSDNARMHISGLGKPRYMHSSISSLIMLSTHGTPSASGSATRVGVSRRNGITVTSRAERVALTR